MTQSSKPTDQGNQKGSTQTLSTPSPLPADQPGTRSSWLFNNMKVQNNFFLQLDMRKAVGISISCFFSGLVYYFKRPEILKWVSVFKILNRRIPRPRKKIWINLSKTAEIKSKEDLKIDYETIRQKFQIKTHQKDSNEQIQTFFCGHPGTAKSTLMNHVAYVLNQHGHPVVPLYKNDDQKRQKQSQGKAASLIEEVWDSEFFISKNIVANARNNKQSTQISYAPRDRLVFKVFKSMKMIVDSKKLRYSTLSGYSFAWFFPLYESYFYSNTIFLPMIFTCLGFNWKIKPFLLFLARPKMVFLIVDDMTSYIRNNRIQFLLKTLVNISAFGQFYGRGLFISSQAAAAFYFKQRHTRLHKLCRLQQLNLARYRIPLMKFKDPLTTASNFLTELRPGNYTIKNEDVLKQLDKLLSDSGWDLRTFLRASQQIFKNRNEKIEVDVQLIGKLRVEMLRIIKSKILIVIKAFQIQNKANQQLSKKIIQLLLRTQMKMGEIVIKGCQDGIFSDMEMDTELFAKLLTKTGLINQFKFIPYSQLAIEAFQLWKIHRKQSRKHLKKD